LGKKQIVTLFILDNNGIYLGRKCYIYCRNYIRGQW
jgi:hypothetical protein